MNSLISKQAAIDALTTYIYNLYKVVVGKTLPVEDCRDAAENVIDDLPPVQPKRGHWEFGDGFFENAICSCCEWDSSEPMEYAEKNFYFCPNCGADMRGNTNV